MVAAYYRPTDEEMLKSVIFKTFQHTCYKSFPHFFHGSKFLNEVRNTFINNLLKNQLRIKKLSSHAIKGLIEQGYKIWIDGLFQTLCDVKLANSTIYNDFMVQLCSIVESQLKKPFIINAFCDENMNRLTSEICARLQQKATSCCCK